MKKVENQIVNYAGSQTLSILASVVLSFIIHVFGLSENKDIIWLSIIDIFGSGRLGDVTGFFLFSQ